MKKKVLSIALVCAIVLSCFSAVVFATDGTTESTEVLGGVWDVKQLNNNKCAMTEKVAGEEKNTTVNTPFKNIDFEKGQTTRTFKFAVYNGTNTTVTIGPSYYWATNYSANNKVDNGKVTDGITRPEAKVSANTYSEISLAIPSDYYWNNGSAIDGAGSNGEKVDGSGLGFRVNFGVGNVTNIGKVYIVCIESDDVTADEVKTINANLSALKFGSEISCSSITDWEQDEYTQELYDLIDTGLGGLWTVNGTNILSSVNKETGKNTTVNTPFKNIYFGDGQTTRTFKFALYNATDANVGFSLSCGYGTYSATKVEKNGDNTYTVYNEQTNSNGKYVASGIKSGEYRTFEITVPSGYWWLNHGSQPALNEDGETRTATSADASTHGSGCYLDGSSVGIRMDFASKVSGQVYMVCLESEGVTKEEVKQINNNLSTLTGNSLVASDVNKDVLIATEKGFYAYNHTFKKGTDYYNRLIPVIENVSETGETDIQSQLTVYNNSGHGIKVHVYPQYNWGDLNSSSIIGGENIYLAPKTKYTFDVGVKAVDGKVTLKDNAQASVSDGKLFYRVDVIATCYENQSDLFKDNKILIDTDITVFNESNTKYDFTKSGQNEKGSATLTLPTDCEEVSDSTKPVFKLVNGDFEDLNLPNDIWDARWSNVSTTLEKITSDNDERGNYSLKCTTNGGKWSTALFNVAPAIYNGEVTDGVYNGAGAGIYKVSFMAKAESDDNGAGKYNIRLDPVEAGSNKLSENEPKITMTSEWKTYTVYFEITEEDINKYFSNDKSFADTKVLLRLDGSQEGNALINISAENPCTYYLDNVTIEKVEFDADVESSLTISDSLALNVYVATSVKKVDVTFDGEKTTLTEPTLDKGKNKFTFSGITPEKMTDEVTFVCYQEVTSGKYVTKEYKTSVKEYLTSILNNEKSDEKTKNLTIDTLNYGAMSQIYANYKTGNLANKDLDSALQTAYVNAEKPANAYAQTGDGFSWASASLQLEDTVNVKFNIKKSDYVEGMVVDVNGTKLTDWKESGDKIYVVYKGIKATELGNTLTAKVMQGENQVSKTLTYSVGTYVNRMWEKENANLLKSLVKYGNSAVEYANK